jgi:hypothetical protein
VKTLRLFCLGIRLSLAGGRSSVVRLVLMSVGLAAGVSLLIVALSVGPAISARHEREAARQGTHPQGSMPSEGSVTYRWNLQTTFEGTDVLAIAVRGAGANPPIPPGLPRLPSPGEVYASPLLAHLLNGPEGRLLEPRFPGRIVGILPPTGLLYPGEVVGYVAAPQALQPATRRTAVTSFTRVPAPGPMLDLGGLMLLSLAVIALLLPLGLFVLTTTRLSASTRETRFAAVRLAGGTQAEVNVLATAESGITAGVGCVLALPLFLIERSLLGSASLIGIRWFSNDLSPPPAGVGALLIGVPLFAVIVTAMTMRRIVISPLGIVRKVRRSRRGARWPAVMATGLLLLVWAAARHGIVLHYPSPIPGVIIGGGLGLTLIGLTGTAPWLGWLAARWIARRSPTPSVLLGARRLEAEPTSAGRVVSGIAVLIVLTGVTQAFVLAQTRDLSGSGVQTADWVRRLDATTMIAEVPDGQNHAPALRSLDGVPGVQSVELTRRLIEANGTSPFGETAIIETDGRSSTLEGIRNGLAWIPAAQVDTVPALLTRVSPAASDTKDLGRLLEGITILLLSVTAASLLVATVDGMMERRRVLAALSATGVPNGVLRRSVVVQIALPLFAALSLGVGGALAVAWLLFRALEIAPIFPISQLLVLGATVGTLVLLVAAASVPWAGVTQKPELLRAE